MNVIVCDQAAVLGDGCPGCGGWLHRVQRGGVPGPMGQHCDEDCAADSQQWLARHRAQHHLAVRDLMCDCETCRAAGRPTEAERAEWADYRAQYPDGGR